MDALEAVANLGKRVVLSEPVGGYPRGRTGLLMSIQSGIPPDPAEPRGEPHCTVAFELDEYWEENVPFRALRPLS